MSFDFVSMPLGDRGSFLPFKAQTPDHCDLEDSSFHSMEDSFFPFSDGASSSCIPDSPVRPMLSDSLVFQPSDDPQVLFEEEEELFDDALSKGNGYYSSYNGFSEDVALHSDLPLIEDRPLGSLEGGDRFKVISKTLSELNAQLSSITNLLEAREISSWEPVGTDIPSSQTRVKFGKQRLEIRENKETRDYYIYQTFSTYASQDLRKKKKVVSGAVKFGAIVYLLKQTLPESKPVYLSEDEWEGLEDKKKSNSLVSSLKISQVEDSPFWSIKIDYAYDEFVHAYFCKRTTIAEPDTRYRWWSYGMLIGNRTISGGHSKNGSISKQVKRRFSFPKEFAANIYLFNLQNNSRLNELKSEIIFYYEELRNRLMQSPTVSVEKINREVIPLCLQRWGSLEKTESRLVSDCSISP